MGVGAQKDLGGHQTFARKMTLNFSRKVISFSVHIKVISKKKRSLLKLIRFNEYKIVQKFDANLPKKYEIAQNFDAIFSKCYKIARNFDSLKPSGEGGQCPPGPPPPTPMPTSPQKRPVLGSRTALFFDWLKRKITKQKITKNSSFSIHFFSLFEKYHILWLPSHSKPYFKWHCVKALIGEWGAKGSVELLFLFLLIFLVRVVQTAKP